MNDNSQSAAGRPDVPPPVLTRTVAPAAAPAVPAPMMPPFVPGRAASHADRAAEALAAAPELPDWTITPQPGSVLEEAPAEVSAPAPLASAAAADSAPMPWEEPAPPARAAVEDDAAWPLLMEAGSAEPAWDNGDEIAGGPAEFPLDAFIIPEDTQRLPTGYEEEYQAIAERVASRLDELARQVRTRGLSQLGVAPGAASPDELTRLIAAVVAGYVGRGGDA